jgi:hypothetical protein
MTLSPEGHSIAPDVESILGANNMSPGVVNDEEPLFEQARAKIPQPPLPRNKGKGRAWTSSEDSVNRQPCHPPSQVSLRDPSDNDKQPQWG